MLVEVTAGGCLVLLSIVGRFVLTAKISTWSIRCLISGSGLIATAILRLLLVGSTYWLAWHSHWDLATTVIHRLGHGKLRLVLLLISSILVVSLVRVLATHCSPLLQHLLLIDVGLHGVHIGHALLLDAFLRLVNSFVFVLNYSFLAIGNTYLHFMIL